MTTIAEHAERIYRAYPVHKSRIRALEAIKVKIRGGYDPAVILAGAEAVARAVANGKDLEFTLHCATWVRAGGWMDETDKVSKPVRTFQPNSPKTVTPPSEAEAQELWQVLADNGADPQARATFIGRIANSGGTLVMGSMRLTVPVLPQTMSVTWNWPKEIELVCHGTNAELEKKCNKELDAVRKRILAAKRERETT